MTELLPKPRPSDFNGIDHDRYKYVFNNDRDLMAYRSALLEYYKRLAEFAIERMQSVIDDQLDIENARETLYLTLSTIKQSEHHE